MLFFVWVYPFSLITNLLCKNSVTFSFSFSLANNKVELYLPCCKEPIRVQKRTRSFLFAICCGLSSTHEPNSLIFYTSKLKRGSCPTRWVEYEYFSYFLPWQKKSNMGRSYTHKNHQLIFISNWLNSAFSRILERFLLCKKTVSLYLRKCLVWSTLFYVLLNIVYFPRVCDTNLSVWKKKEPPNEWF